MPAVLLGHSMGGKVAMKAAVRTQKHVTDLTVADIASVDYSHAN